MAYSVWYNEALTTPPTHTHTCYELFFVAEGEGTMIIQGNSYPVSRGSLVFLNQFEEHEPRLSSSVFRRYGLFIPIGELNGLNLDSHLLSVFRMHGTGFPYVMQVGDEHERIEDWFRLMVDAGSYELPLREMRIGALLTLLLTEAAGMRPDMFAQKRENSGALMALLDELDQHCTEPFSMEQLAERFNTNASSLSDRFHRMIGLSPMQYVTLNRLTLAKKMLLEGNAPVNEVALACGFRDTSNFVRRFRQEYDCTPLQFRLQQRRTPVKQIERVK